MGRLSYMEAELRTGASPRLRALAIVLACALGLALGTVGRSSSGHRHLPRGVAAVAASADDHLPGAHRVDHVADVVRPAPVTALTRGHAGTADPSTSVRSATAQSPPARGPPSEAAG
jgi:hypothetical protein